MVTSTDTHLDIQDEPADLSHLHPAAQEIARLPDEERLRYVRADRWIGYPRTTAALERLETLFSWPSKQRMRQPWLFDTLYVRDWDEQTLFDTYVRDNSVLLAPGEAGRHQVGRFKRWVGPWLPVPNGWPRRVCPVCAADPDRGASLMWKLPLMAGCVDHGCWLEDVQDVEVPLALNGHPPAARPVDEPLATLDRYTHDALATGRVELPGRSAHAGVWFRLLRSLLDEVSLATSTVSKQGRTTLEQVWEGTGRPDRGGLTVWKPYEQLDRDTQETMLYAAAVVLHLAADRRITTRGLLASVIQPPADRTDPEPARQTLRLLTAFDSSPHQSRQAAPLPDQPGGYPARVPSPRPASHTGPDRCRDRRVAGARRIRARRGPPGGRRLPRPGASAHRWPRRPVRVPVRQPRPRLAPHPTACPAQPVTAAAGVSALAVRR